MDYYSIACDVLQQMSRILTVESGKRISLIPTNHYCWMGNDISIEIEEVDIPQNLIGVPCPKYEQEKEGLYKVNRVHVGKTILEDTFNGFPFDEREMKQYIKGRKTWAYCL